MGRPGALPDRRVLGAGREELTDLDRRWSTLWLGATVVCFTFAEPLRGQQPPPEADSVVAIDPVTVEVGRLRAGAVPLARTPFPSQVVDAAELDGPGRRELAGTLSTLPGVTLTNQTGSGSQADIRLRGFAVSPIVGVPQSVSVFVDGVRVNEADASQVHLSLIPAAAVERIELVRGPVGVFGKNSIAGALNFVTRRADGPPSVTAEIEGGSFDRWAGTLRAQGTAGSLDALVTASYAQSEGWRLLQSSEELSIFAKAGWRGERTDAWISYTFEADSLEGPGPLPESWLEGGPLPPDLIYPTSDPRRLQYTGGKGDAFVPRLHFLNAQADHRLSDAWSVQMDGFGRFADFRQTNDNLSEPDALGVTDIGSFGSTLQLLYQPNDRLFVAGGLEGTRNDVDIEIHEVPNRAFPSISQAITEHLKTDEDNLGVFGEAWWEVGDRLAVYGSLRYDHVSLPVRDLLDPADSGDNTFSELSGGLGVSSDLSPGANVFASWGRGFRAPVILEVTCADPEDPCQLPFELGPDPPLLPVKSDTWQLGLRLSGALAEGSVVGYWTDVRDDIFNVVDETTPTRGFFTNLDRTRRVGLEAAASATPLRGVSALRLSGSVAWTRATFESPAELASPLLEPDTTATGADDGPVVVEPGDRFPMVPELSASLGATYRVGSVTLGAEASWTGSQYLVGDEGNDEELPRLDAFTVVDLSLQWDAGPTTVFAELSNVFDADYAAFGIVSENGRASPEETERFLTPGLPRRITVGVRAQVF
jgi:iron complex outermembrane receptor protein